VNVEAPAVHLAPRTRGRRWP